VCVFSLLCSTFVCPTEICAFNDRAEEFHKINAEVAAVSGMLFRFLFLFLTSSASLSFLPSFRRLFAVVDSKYSHLAWTKLPRKEGGLGEMNIPIIEDVNKAISRAYGVLHEGDGVAFRGLFIIDTTGTIRQITINDMPIGRSVDETLRLVQAIQYNDQHGEVCPANWKPGMAAMKADPKGSLEFFAGVHTEADGKRQRTN